MKAIYLESIRTGKFNSYIVESVSEILEIAFEQHESELRDAFDNELNDTHELISVCGHAYEPARALKLLDRIAYDCAFHDWMDARIDDIANELDSDGITGIGEILIKDETEISICRWE